MNSVLILIASLAIIAIIAWELFFKRRVEGFTTLQELVVKSIPRRYDVTMDNPLSEDPGKSRDLRFWEGYTDVQRLGVDNDFCRMVVNNSVSGEMAMCCALAGTENLDSCDYRTPYVSEGLQISRDDYMKQAGQMGPGPAYCKILKMSDGSWQSMCNEAGLQGFQTQLIQDTSPPNNITRLLQYYEGILVWYRFIDDMLDYAQNTHVYVHGGMVIDETPSRRDMAAQTTAPLTEGLQFNATGSSQYLRIGEGPQLQLGMAVPLRSVRTISVWVRYDKFTNYAPVFCFANGPIKGKIWLTIEGTGNATASTASELPSTNAPLLATQDNQVCRPPPHAPEFSPQQLLNMTDAQVDKYACPFPSTAADEPTIANPIATQALRATQAPNTANLIYEIWDEQERKMRIRIVDFFTEGQWTHVVITAASGDAQRPDINVYKNGKLNYTQLNGWLPQVSTTTNNYLGRDSDEDPTTQWADKSERFVGKMFDFRLYNIPLSAEIVADIYDWGKTSLAERSIGQILDETDKGPIATGSVVGADTTPTDISGNVATRTSKRRPAKPAKPTKH